MWLRNLKDTYCDVQPDVQETHLPFGTKLDVYRLFCRYYNTVCYDGSFQAQHVIHSKIMWLVQGLGPCNYKRPRSPATKLLFEDLRCSRKSSQQNHVRACLGRTAARFEGCTAALRPTVPFMRVVSCTTSSASPQTRCYHRFAICKECADIQDEINLARRQNLKDRLKLWQRAKEMHRNNVRCLNVPLLQGSLRLLLKGLQVCTDESCICFLLFCADR